MNGFFSSRKKETVESDRDKQIRELRESFPNIRKPFKDDTAFDVLFRAGTLWCTLKIFLNGDFPNVKPTLQVTGIDNHPWLDQYKQVTGSAMLTNWNRNSSIVEVVKEVIAVLQASPSATNVATSQRRVPSGNDLASSTSAYPTLPQVSEPPQYPLARPTASYGAPPPAYDAVYREPSRSDSMQGHYNNMNGSRTSSYQSNLDANMDTAPSSSNKVPILSNEAPSRQRNSDLPTESKGSTLSKPDLDRNISKTKTPDVPMEFPELEQLSDDQLERLLSDKVAIKAHALSYADITTLKEMLQQSRLSNQELVTSNLRKREDLLRLSDDVQSSRQILDSKIQQYNNLLESVAAKHFKSENDIISEVQKRRDELDRESVLISRKFEEGETDLSSFLQEYIEKRAQYHMLCCKLEAYAKF